MSKGAFIYLLVKVGGGVHKMTMNDHEGEGFRNDYVVRWIEFLENDEKV